MKLNAIKSHQVILVTNGLVHHTARLMFINKMLHIWGGGDEGTLSSTKLTPRSIVLPEKLMLPQKIKKSPTFYENHTLPCPQE